MAKLEGVKTLDMVNGEITKVAYGGAAYERVEGEAKAGDIGLRIDKPTSYATVGAFYQFVYDLGGLSFIDDVGDKPYVAGNHFAIFRKVAAASVEAEPKPERLKVGDYAKVVGDESGHYAELNEIVLVERDDRGRVPFLCKKLNGNNAGWFYGAELVRATDEEVAEAKRAAKWAEIGREVGEYKKGDIARYEYLDNEICEVLEITEGGRVRVQTANHGICKEKPSDLRLITPVEARFDR
ncbi:hypothetical protein [Bacillus subtilis]|nr:hypothetical protein [Bacillus subtilis]